MELRHYLSIAQIMISVVLSVLVLLQVKGTGFGAALGGWVRVALTQPDALVETACARIAAHVAALNGVQA